MKLCRVHAVEGSLGQASHLEWGLEDNRDLMQSWSTVVILEIYFLEINVLMCSEPTKAFQIASSE